MIVPPPDLRRTDAQPPAGVWFPAKRYGWGWGLPVAWQGWAVMVVWLAVFAVGAAVLAGRTWAGFAAFTVAMVLGILAICYAKGERPRWRWGE